MNKTSVIFFVLLTLCACSDNNSTGKGSNSDSTDNPGSQMQPSSPDSGASSGDTSMYQRMPNKMNDSTPK